MFVLMNLRRDSNNYDERVQSELISSVESCETRIRNFDDNLRVEIISPLIFS